MKVRYLVALVSFVCASASWAREPFIVKDIRVDGIQRTEAGTVFSYLPVKVGDTLDDEKAAAAIKALYATGFFKDVRLESEDGVLVVVVEERPAIAQISIIGAKEFEKDKLKEGLKLAGSEYVVLGDGTTQYQPFHIGITCAEHHRAGGFFLNLDIHVDLVRGTRDSRRFNVDGIEKIQPVYAHLRAVDLGG